MSRPRTVHTQLGNIAALLQLWTAQPPLAEWIRRGQPAHTTPQRPPGAERKGREWVPYMTWTGQLTDNRLQGQLTDRHSLARSIDRQSLELASARGHGMTGFERVWLHGADSVWCACV
eukprot:352606-Chlamydomonas_euryale.AAC.1